MALLGALVAGERGYAFGTVWERGDDRRILTRGGRFAAPARLAAGERLYATYRTDVHAAGLIVVLRRTALWGLPAEDVETRRLPAGSRGDLTFAVTQPGDYALWVHADGLTGNPDCDRALIQSPWFGTPACPARTGGYSVRWGVR